MKCLLSATPSINQKLYAAFKVHACGVYPTSITYMHIISSTSLFDQAKEITSKSGLQIVHYLRSFHYLWILVFSVWKGCLGFGKCTYCSNVDYERISHKFIFINQLFLLSNNTRHTVSTIHWGALKYQDEKIYNFSIAFMKGQRTFKDYNNIIQQVIKMLILSKINKDIQTFCKKQTKKKQLLDNTILWSWTSNHLQYEESVH